jgi:hypothetical protein
MPRKIENMDSTTRFSGTLAVLKRGNMARTYVAQDKAKKKCSRCGEGRPSCLDYHHVNPSLKYKAVSAMTTNYGLSRIKVEIEKCIVLCANCHRVEEFGDGFEKVEDFEESKSALDEIIEEKPALEDWVEKNGYSENDDDDYY